MSPNPAASGGLKWDSVKFPETALDAGKGLGDADGDDGTEAINWVSTPATSHVHSFAIVVGTGRRKDVLKGSTWIYVRFRNKFGHITSRYGYEFQTAEPAMKIFEELKRAAHPGAHQMIKTPFGIPGMLGYTRLG